MRIIGTTRGGFLVDATGEELANLAGYQYDGQYTMYYGDRLTIKTLDVLANGCAGKVLQIGDEFAISKAWKQILRNAGRVLEIELIRKSLEGAIHNLDMAEPFLNEPEPQKEGV
jgi:hypothetical protein